MFCCLSTDSQGAWAPGPQHSPKFPSWPPNSWIWAPLSFQAGVRTRSTVWCSFLIRSALWLLCLLNMFWSFLSIPFEILLHCPSVCLYTHTHTHAQRYTHTQTLGLRLESSKSSLCCKRNSHNMSIVLFKEISLRTVRSFLYLLLLWGVQAWWGYFILWLTANWDRRSRS